MLVNCPNCNKQISKWPGQIKKGWLACSRECQYKLAFKQIKKECLTCGKEFYARRHDVKNGNRGKYCSRPCFIDDPIKRPIMKKCCNCRKVLRKTPSQIKGRKNIFCSKKCIGIYLTKEIEVGCDRCGKSFMKNPSNITRHNWCSARCRKRPFAHCQNCNRQRILYRGKFCRLCYRANYEYPRKYNISAEEYSRGVSGACMICSTKPNATLHVDHDHNTGKTRGFLCSPCNTALGLFQDNLTNLQNAINYLRKGGEL